MYISRLATFVYSEIIAARDCLFSHFTSFQDLLTAAGIHLNVWNVLGWCAAMNAQEANDSVWITTKWMMKTIATFARKGPDLLLFSITCIQSHDFRTLASTVVMPSIETKSREERIEEMNKTEKKEVTTR